MILPKLGMIAEYRNVKKKEAIWFSFLKITAKTHVINFRNVYVTGVFS